MNNLFVAEGEQSASRGNLDLAEVSVQLLNLSIQLLERTPYSIAVCHAQMARDVLVKAICPEIAFVAGCDVGVAQ